MRDQVTIRRLRPAYDAATLKQVYDHQYDHTRWYDHIQRVHKTIECIHEWTTPEQRRVVADLSCGDAAIARSIADVEELILGDYVRNEEYTFMGPIEQTIHHIGGVDLFILSETLEHIDEPAALLVRLKDRVERVLISTPLDEQDDGNPEHYWGWDEDGIRDLLAVTGWTVQNSTLFTPVPDAYYTYQIWLVTCMTP